MSSRILRRSLLAGGLLIIAVATTHQTYAASGDGITDASSSSSSLTGEGTLEVQQLSVNVIGRWTLLKPGSGNYVSGEALKALDHLPAGSYTIIATPPDGAIASLRLTNRGEEVLKVDRSQATFTMRDGDALKLTINYTFTRVGTVSVQSDPSGIPFSLSGPNNTHINGTTPESYLNMPEGQYKVQFEALEGCVLPAPKSAVLEKNKRVSFDITVSCATADELRDRQDPGNSKFVSLVIDGESVTFRDVSLESWFANDVFKAAQRGVVAGDKDENGNLTGTFRPGSDVTIAELAKIAHKMAGLSEYTDAPPLNSKAIDTWFSGFIASAEQRGWTIFADASIDPGRPATRGEVVVTVLQALDEPVEWPHGGVFTDVTVRTPFAGAIETAAKAKIIAGHKDEEGNLTGTFGPLDPINRAELSKILNAAMEKFLGIGQSSVTGARGR